MFIDNNPGPELPRNVPVSLDMNDRQCRGDALQPHRAHSPKRFLDMDQEGTSGIFSRFGGWGKN